MLELQDNILSTKQYPILEMKIQIPDNPIPWLQRPFLIQKLNGIFSKKLVLINAPAGYGKTTLIGSWAKTITTPVAWLTLGDGENNIVRFWDYMYAAIEKSDPSLPIRSNIHSNSDSIVESTIIQFIQQMMVHSSDVLLVLDNVQKLCNVRTLHSLAYLIEHLPLNLKIVLISRSEPKLPLHRIRSSNNLIDIDTEDLRFNKDELTVFYNELYNLHLTQKEINRIENYTEGWIAGVNLLQLTLGNQSNVIDFIPSLNRNNKYIDSYFSREIIGAFNKQDKEILLKAAIFDDFSGPMLNEIMNNERSNKILSRLINDNSFVFLVDKKAHVYRLHNAFKDILYNQLVLEYGPATYLLHEKAARWFFTHGDIERSINHAFHAKKYELASDYLIKSYPKLSLEKRFSDIEYWLNQFPEQWMLKQPKLRIIKVWMLFSTNRASEMAAELHGINLFLLNNPIKDVELEVEVINGFKAFLSGNTEKLISIFKKVISDDRMGNLLKYEFVLNKNEISLLHSRAGMFGRLKQAETLYAQLKKLCTPTYHSVSLTFQTISNEIHYEWNQLNQVRESVEKIISYGQEYGKLSLLIPNLRLQLKLASIDMNLPEMWALMEEADRKLIALRDVEYSKYISFAMRAEIYINCHQLDMLVPLLNTTDKGFADKVTHNTVYPIMIYAEALSLTGRVTQSLELVNKLLAYTESKGKLGLTIKLYFLKSMILYRSSQNNDAYVFLEIALKLARPEGYIRSFIDKKGIGYDLINSFHACFNTSEEIGEYINQLLHAFADETGEEKLMVESSGNRMLVDPLTDRELDVLRLVRAGLTNKEISNKLFISVGTVKGYNHNIFSKLGVRNRTQAHIKAKELKVF